MRRRRGLLVPAVLLAVAACQENRGGSARGTFERVADSEAVRGPNVASRDTPHTADSGPGPDTTAPPGNSGPPALQDTPPPPDTAIAATDVEPPASQADSSFAGTTDVIQRTRTAPPVAILRDVRVAQHPGYDRIVFEFSEGPLPGYHVEYSEGPVHECGSGREIDVQGSGRLLVRLEPAQAHDDRGNVTIQQRQRTTALPALKRMSITCDFEAQVEWVLGVDARAPYRVLELTGPPRLVVDVRHEP